jgi:hypothetical protein
VNSHFEDEAMSTIPRSAVSPHLQRILKRLQRAHDVARRLGRDPWDFAVSLAELTKLDFAIDDFVKLAAQGLVEHRLETTGTGQSKRTFGLNQGIFLSPDTCLILTPAGARWVQESCRCEDSETPTPLLALWTETPHWQPTLRELHFAGRLVKRFRQPADAQEAVLNAFETLGWPTVIDDPLPGQEHHDPKQRLLYTTKNLNRHQSHRCLYFFGIGNGRQLGWRRFS